MLAWRRFRHKAGRSRFRVPLTWVRHGGLDPNDVFLASYPRSGSTWTRFVLYEILTGGFSSFDNINRGIPEVGMHWRGEPLLPGGGRLIKTHEPYRKEYRKAIYLVRDVRDVLFSQYSRERELGIVYDDFDTYLVKFAQGKISGFGAWQNHVARWLRSPLEARGDLLVLRFEDMRKDMESAITGMLEFLGIEAAPALVRTAIANNSLERMREKETQSQTFRQSKVEEGRFVRKGSIGGWRERLSAEQLRLFDAYAGDVFRRLGYPLGAEVASARTQSPTGSLAG